MFEQTPSRQPRKRLYSQNAYPMYPPMPPAGYTYVPQMARRPRRSNFALLLITLLVTIPGGIWMFMNANPLITAREALFWDAFAALLVVSLMALALWKKSAEYWGLFLFIVVCLIAGGILH